MTSRDFCYWLQGYIEIAQSDKNTEQMATQFSSLQVECLRKHLSLVFKHEIDPSMGDVNHQQILNNAHNTMPNPPKNPNGVARC